MKFGFLELNVEFLEVNVIDGRLRNLRDVVFEAKNFVQFCYGF